MRKPFKHTDVDTSRKCVVCHKPLKKNLLAKRHNAEKCFSCTNPERKANKIMNRQRNKEGR